MRGSLIGFGTIAMGHLAAYQQMEGIIAIDAVVDPSPVRRQYAATIMPDLHIYESIAQLFSAETPDFLDICSPPCTHDEYIFAGLSNNCHVLCEKPVWLATNSYAQIIPKIESGRTILYPSHNYKFSPILRSIKEIIQSGQIGQVMNGHFRTFRHGHALGVPEWNPHWRRIRSISGGGILQDHGPHSIYIACELCGRYPTAVSCITGSLKTDQYADTEDTSLLVMHFDDNLQFAIDLSWAASFRNSYYAVIGSAGTVIVENDDLIHTSHDGQLLRRTISSDFNDPSHAAWFRDMLMDFMDVVIHPHRQWQLIEEACIVAMVIEHAYASAMRGGEVIHLPHTSKGQSQ